MTVDEWLEQNPAVKRLFLELVCAVNRDDAVYSTESVERMQGVAPRRWYMVEEYYLAPAIEELRRLAVGR